MILGGRSGIANLFRSPVARGARLAVLGLSALLLSWSAKPVSAADEDGQIWIGWFNEGTFKFNDNVGWWLEGQTRWRDVGETYHQFLVRPALGYWFDDSSAAWVGYAYSRVFNDDGPRGEHRSWIGYNFYWPGIKPLSVILRTRLEQRWFDRSNEVGHRIRQLVRVSHPIAGLRNVDWVLRNETFFYLNNTDFGALQGYEDNRAFIGIAIHRHDKSRMEFGYMNKFGRGRPNDTIDHIIAASLYMKF